MLNYVNPNPVMPIGQAGPPISEEEREKLRQMAAMQGRNWDDLTPQEQEALFRSYDSERAIAAELALSPAPQGKQIGRVYAAPTWSENLGNAAQKMYGMYQLGQLNRSEKAGRKAAADLSARRDQLDRQDEESRARAAEREREQWLRAIMGGRL